MPTHQTPGGSADDLAVTVAHVEALGEDIIDVVPAGSGWAVVTRTAQPTKVARTKTKPQTR